MAGPTSSVLLKSIPDELTFAKLYDVLKKISDKIEQDDFWVVSTRSIGGTVDAEGQPFGISKNLIDSEYYNYSEEEITLIHQHIGFRPTFEIGIYAMCNGEVDHRILGELSCYLANELGGIINFSGAIYPYISLPYEMKKGMWLWEEATWRDIQPYFEKMIEHIDGKIYTIEYLTANRRNWAYHLCDVTFMMNWLKNPNFHMVK